MLDRDAERHKRHNGRRQSAEEFRRALVALHMPQLADPITNDLDRIGWNLQRIARALEKCRRYPD